MDDMRIFASLRFFPDILTVDDIVALILVIVVRFDSEYGGVAISRFLELREFSVYDCVSSHFSRRSNPLTTLANLF